MRSLHIQMFRHISIFAALLASNCSVFAAQLENKSGNPQSPCSGVNSAAVLPPIPPAPPEGIWIPTDGHVPEANVAFGFAASVDPDASRAFVAHPKVQVCELPGNDGKVGAPIYDLWITYFDAKATDRAKSSISGKLGGSFGGFSASGSGSYDWSSVLSSNKESLVIGVRANPTRTFSSTLKLQQNVVKACTDASTFEALYQILGDGVITSHRLGQGILIVADLSNISKETQSKLETHMKAGFASVANASLDSVQEVFKSNKTDTVSIRAIADNVQLPSSLANVISSDNRPLLSQIAQIVHESVQNLQNATSGEGNASAVTLIAPYYVAEFPLKGTARLNYKKIIDLRFQFMREQQAFENLEDIRTQANFRGVQITNDNFEQAFSTPASQQATTQNAFEQLFATSFSDEDNFAQAYKRAVQELECFHEQISLLRRQPVSISIRAERDTHSEKPFIMNFFNMPLKMTSAASWSIEGTFSPKLVVHSIAPSTFSQLEPRLEVSASLALDSPKGKLPFSAASSVIKFREALDQFATLRVNAPTPMDGKVGSWDPINIPPTSNSKLAGGVTYPDDPNSPLQITLTGPSPESKASAINAAMTVVLRFTAGTTVGAIEEFCKFNPTTATSVNQLGWQ